MMWSYYNWGESSWIYSCCIKEGVCFDNDSCRAAPKTRVNIPPLILVFSPVYWEFYLERFILNFVFWVRDETEMCSCINYFQPFCWLGIWCWWLIEGYNYMGKAMTTDIAFLDHDNASWNDGDSDATRIEHVHPCILISFVHNPLEYDEYDEYQNE